MNGVEHYIKTSLVILAVLSLALAVFAVLTGAMSSLKRASAFFLTLSVLFFLLSVLVWLFSWSLLLVKHSKERSFAGVFCWGFASVFGSLTPIQLGSDALRSIFLREHLGIGFSESFSASMIVKGLKFSVLALASTFIISWALIEGWADAMLFVPLFSGLLVVVLAALLFLLPLKKSIGYKISRFFARLSARVLFLKPLEGYFVKYSDYLSRVRSGMLVVVFAMAALSWFFEFFSLFFAFLSLGIKMPFLSILVLFVLIAVLERTPLLPRGVLLVETVGFAFLSFPLITSASLSVPQIASVLVLFDLSRLVMPAVLSAVFYAFYSKGKGTGANKLE